MHQVGRNYGREENAGNGMEIVPVAAFCQIVYILLIECIICVLLYLIVFSLFSGMDKYVHQSQLDNCAVWKLKVEKINAD